MVSKYSSTVAVNASSPFTKLLLCQFQRGITYRNFLRSCIFPFIYSIALYSESRKESTMTVALPNYLPDRSRLRATPMRFSGGFVRCLRMFLKKFMLVLLIMLLLFAGSGVGVVRAGLVGGG